MSISAMAGGEKKDGLSELTKYIPTEVVTVYIGLLALYDPIKRRVGDGGVELPLHASDFGTRWQLFIALAILTPIITGLIFLYRARPGDPGPDEFKVGMWLLASAVAVVGLAIWASALPDSPAYDFEDWGSKVSTGAILVFSALAPLTAKAFGLHDFAD